MILGNLNKAAWATGGWRSAPSRAWRRPIPTQFCSRIANLIWRGSWGAGEAPTGETARAIDASPSTGLTAMQESPQSLAFRCLFASRKRSLAGMLRMALCWGHANAAVEPRRRRLGAWGASAEQTATSTSETRAGTGPWIYSELKPAVENNGASTSHCAPWGALTTARNSASPPRACCLFTRDTSSYRTRSTYGAANKQLQQGIPISCWLPPAR